MARILQIKNCVICGHRVWRPHLHEADVPEFSWKQRYRILYRDFQSDTRISGLASHRDSRAYYWYAPWDHDDTKHYSGVTNMPEHESICVMSYCYSRDTNHLRYGFPAHQSCWTLLEKAFSPNPIPYETLFNMCKSLEGEQPGKILDWGHDYGGAVRVTSGSRIGTRNLDDSRDTPDFLDRDPCSSEDIEGLLVRSSQTTPFVAGVSLEHITSKDCLSLLPYDVRLLIADLLPTADFYALRLASESFHFIFHQQSFWARKFAPGGERDWLFEAPDINKKHRVDWRSLYKITSGFDRLPPPLRNRVRIWKYIKFVKDATPQSPIQSVTSPAEPTPDCEFDVWATVTSDVDDSLPLFPGAANSPEMKLPRQRFQLPGSLEEIHGYFIQFDTVTFISGITFLTTSQRRRHIGYKTGSLRKLKLREDPIGFNVELESRGILCIQAVYPNGDMSPWLGDRQAMPLTRRLVLHDHITAVEGLFDGCKLITLSLSRHPPKTNAEEEAMREQRASVFHSGIWYPEMPDITMNLHENHAKLPYNYHPTVVGEAVVGSRYLPIWFMRFGVKDGQQLLGSLSAVHGNLGDTIIFSYESNDAHQPDRTWPVRPGYEHAKHPSFEIDGKGGERFVIARLAVEVDLKPDQDPFVYGELTSFVVSRPIPFIPTVASLITNRGRECRLFDFALQYNGDVITTDIKMDDPEFMTGIYGIPGGMSIGIVSEMLSDSS